MQSSSRRVINIVAIGSVKTKALAEENALLKRRASI
jgi:hypothetical protein